MPLPRFILRGEYSINAKLLYALLLGRTQLSQKSGWVSEDRDVYVIYTIRQMANDLNRSERTVKAALAELENAGLIIRVRQSWNRANRIFLQLHFLQQPWNPMCRLKFRPDQKYMLLSFVLPVLPAHSHVFYFLI